MAIQMRAKKYRNKYVYVYIIFKGDTIVGIYSPFKHICSTDVVLAKHFTNNEVLSRLTEEQFKRVITYILKDYEYVEDVSYDDPCLKKETWVSGFGNQGGSFW